MIHCRSKRPTLTAGRLRFQDSNRDLPGGGGMLRGDSSSKVGWFNKKIWAICRPLGAPVWVATGFGKIWKEWADPTLFMPQVHMSILYWHRQRRAPVVPGESVEYETVFCRGSKPRLSPSQTYGFWWVVTRALMAFMVVSNSSKGLQQFFHVFPQEVPWRVFHPSLHPCSSHPPAVPEQVQSGSADHRRERLQHEGGKPGQLEWLKATKFGSFPRFKMEKAHENPWFPTDVPLSQPTDLEYGLDIFMILYVCGPITELRHSPNMLQQGPLVGQFQWSELAFGKLMWKSNISGSQLRYVTIMLRWRSAMKTMVAAAVAVRAFFCANHFSCHFLDS